MRVVVIGPNLVDQSKGQFHVHKEGCNDTKKYRGQPLDYVIDVETRKDIVLDIYPPNEFDYNEDTEWMNMDDMYLAPCVNLPQE